MIVNFYSFRHKIIVISAELWVVYTYIRFNCAVYRWSAYQCVQKLFSVIYGVEGRLVKKVAGY